jgi:hypothetical protein
MTHLSDVEIVDLIEYGADSLAPVRAAHLETCESCRRRANDARDTLARAIAADVPEPSPLFWDRFSDRVHEGIGETAAGASFGWRRWLDHTGVRWALSSALVLALIVAAAWRVMAPTIQHAGDLRPSGAAIPPLPPTHDKPATSITDASVNDGLNDDGLNADADPAWAVVRTVADEVRWSESVEVGLAARPDVADRVADTLTSDERAELVRLLQAEIKRPGA